MVFSSSVSISQSNSCLHEHGGDKNTQPQGPAAQEHTTYMVARWRASTAVSPRPWPGAPLVATQRRRRWASRCRHGGTIRSISRAAGRRPRCRRRRLPPRRIGSERRPKRQDAHGARRLDLPLPARPIWTRCCRGGSGHRPADLLETIWGLPAHGGQRRRGRERRGRREKQWVERHEVGLVEELWCGGGSSNPSAREGYRGEEWFARWERRERLGGVSGGRAENQGERGARWDEIKPAKKTVTKKNHDRWDENKPGTQTTN